MITRNGSSQDSNEPLSSIKDTEFVDQQDDLSFSQQLCFIELIMITLILCINGVNYEYHNILYKWCTK
jgi:hypothetical protein